MVLVGGTHVSVPMFAQTIASAYHESISLHFDSMTGGGRIINNTPKLPILTQQIIQQCQANLSSHNQLQLIQQCGPFFVQYFTGLIISGPLGITTITYPGNFIPVPVIQNNDFSIILDAFVLSFRSHIMSLIGTYVSSTVPGLVVPTWSGALLISLP